MRFYIIVIVLKLLSNVIWNDSGVFIKLGAGVVALDPESYLENEHLQSELGELTPDLDDEIVENKEIVGSDGSDAEAIKVEVPNDQKTNITEDKTWNMEPSLVPKLPQSSDLSRDTTMLAYSDSFVAKPPKDVLLGAEIKEGSYINIHQASSINSVISPVSNVTAANNRKPLNYENAELTAEESLQVAAKVLAQNGKEFENENNEESDTDIESHYKISADHTPNIIQPQLFYAGKDMPEIKHLQAYHRRTKDSYILQYIEEDLSWEWDFKGVQEWLQFTHNEQELLLGKRSTDIVILKPRDISATTAFTINVGYPITALETYNFWNFELYQEEGVIIVASKEKLLWYRNNPSTGKFELFGRWLLDGYITQLSHFRKGFEDHLVVGYNHTVMQIFKFHLEHQEYSMTQEIYFERSYKDFLIANLGRDIIMAVSQQDLVTIYILNPDRDMDFKLQQSIVAPGVTSLTSFFIAAKLYLTFSGYEAQILMFNRGEFQSITILGPKFGKVEYFFPIPLKTPQDELILMVHFTINNQSFVESILWNGKTFESGLPVACQRSSQVSKGLSCLLDLPAKPKTNDLDLLGSSLFSRADNVYLIIPGFTEKSQIFRFHFELLPENSELLDLLDYYVILNRWFVKQNHVIAQVKEFLETPEADLIQRALQQETSALDSIETPEFQFSGNVSEIYLNDHLWSKEDSEINLDYLINLIENLEESLTSSRQRRELEFPTQVEYDELTYDTVTVEELEIENLNGKRFFVQNGILEFPGEIEFQDLEVLTNVEEDVQTRQAAEDFVLEGDLEFETINGIKWSDFKKNIVLRNQQQELESLKVEGVIVVEDILTVKSLNTLNFPDDYLLANGPRSSVVRAEKYFVNTLTANAVDTEGLINGQNPLEAITLMDHQEWQGSPTFNHLEVSEKLELHGTAHGRNVDSTPTNPTLQESQIIEASCIFNDLQVNGPIVLKGNLDQQPLAQLLNNIIQKPVDPSQLCEVNSPKTFEEVTFPIDFELENNTINHIPTEDFVTVHTSQSLSVDALDGYAYFYNLTLKGLYDGISLEEILKEMISLDKPVDLGSTQLIFEDQPLQAGTLIVLEQLNGLAIKDNLQTLYEDLSLNSAEFEELQGKVAEFSADILGPGKLNNIELEAFVNDRSWHEPPIQGNLFIHELIASQGIQADELHGIDAENLLEFLQKIDELPEMVLNGQIQVDHITVMEDVQLHKVNGLMFDEDIQMTAIWLNRQNHLATNLTFRNRVEVKGNLKITGNYQGRNLTALLEDFVRNDSNTSDVHITAPKSFLHPVQILQNTQLKAINGKQFENLAFKTQQNIFRGSVKIKGNLITPDLEVAGSITGFNNKNWENLFYYHDKLYNFVLKGTIHFENPIHLNDLTVLGAYNEFPNLPQFFDNLIDKTKACELRGNNTFTGRVTIDQGLYLHQLNGHDLEQLFKNLVFIQGSDTVIIQSPLQFQEPIKANKISIYKSLTATNLNGCSLEEWLNNTLRVDHDLNIPHYLQFAKGSLDNNSLKVHFINGIDMEKVITLNTSQTFEDSIQFSDVVLGGVIKANGSVNGLDLEEEYNNTLMIYGGQNISTPLTIQSIDVLKNLQIRCQVNSNKDLNDVAILQENLDLKSPVYFQSLYSPQFIVKDLVTGIDFDKWFANSLRIHAKPMQFITGNWSTRLLNVKTGPHDFQYTINGFQPWEYNSFIRNVRSFEQEEHVNCEILKNIWRKLKQKSVAIKYIEEDNGINPIVISPAAKRRKLFHLSCGKELILLLNLDCVSYLFKWNSTKSEFILLNSYESGYIDQLVVLPANNSKPLQFVTNYESAQPMNCSVKGLNVWSSSDNFTSHEHFYHENVTDLYRPTGYESSVFVLTRDKVKELNFSSYKIKEKWLMPLNNNLYSKLTYRFLVKEDSEDIFLTNGEQIVSLTHRNNVKTKKQVDYEEYSAPLQPSPYAAVFPDISPISWLKPNSTMARKFIFSDFKQILQRLLLDVIEKLNHHINITQLTIPESDLYDEHLIPDFLTAITQLQQQKIYTKDELNLNFTSITIPENPAHVLATRVVLAVWPKVEELQEIHGFLKDNHTHNHPLCTNITQTLGHLIEQALQEAYPTESRGFNEDMLNVVQVIRTHQMQLQSIVNSLKYDGKKTENPFGELLAAASNEKLRFVPNNLKTQLPMDAGDSPKPEVLSLQVGSVNNSHRLVAISRLHSTSTPGFDSTIHLYAEDLKGNPFQIIAANRPRSLMQLRVAAETLFGFIENCCHVQIWRYQGIQGFVKFADFRSDSVVDQLITITVPQMEGGSKHYLVLLLEEKITFYDILWKGVLYDPPNLPCP